MRTAQKTVGARALVRTVFAVVGLVVVLATTVESVAGKPPGPTAVPRAGAVPKTAAVQDTDPTLKCPNLPAPPSGAANYQGKTLRNVNFAYRSLVGADFSNATLDGVVFVGAKLTGANFSGAKFTNALNGPAPAALPTDFAEADLSRACFDSAKFLATDAPTYFDGAKLTCTDLSNIDLSGKGVVLGPTPGFASDTHCLPRLQGSTLGCDFIDLWRTLDLTNATVGECGSAYTATALVGRTFDHGVMDGFNFSGMNVSGASFRSTSLHGADFSYANLADAKLVGIQAGVDPGSTAQRVSFVAAYMVGVDLSDADLRSADLSYAHIYQTVANTVTFTKARLDSALLDHALLIEADFSGASLTSTVFSNAVLVNAKFGSALIQGAKFDSAYLQGTSFKGAVNVTGVSLNNGAISTAVGYWNDTDNAGNAFTYQYLATDLGALATDTGSFCPNGSKSPCTSDDSKKPSAAGPNWPVKPPCVPAPPTWGNCGSGGGS